MRLAYAILAHEPFEALRPLLKCLTENGDLVALHYDATAPRPDDIEEVKRHFPQVLIASRVAVEWGEASIVYATVNCLRALVDSGQEFDYVTLLSGSCLPVKSARDLKAYLARNPTLEFVEAVDVSHSQWVVDGLQQERWEYPHYFNWRKQRRLFSLSVRAMKLLGRKRQFPLNTRMCMGSQWWTLTTTTIKKILELCDQPGLLAFLEHTWIPDEFFFQTLVLYLIDDERKIRPPLMNYRFNMRGIPKVFTSYDAETIQALPSHKFFIRKVKHTDTALVSTLTDIYLERAHLDELKSPLQEEVGESPLAWLRDTSMEPYPFSRCPVPTAVIITDAPQSPRCLKLRETLVEELAHMQVFGELLAPHEIDYGPGPKLPPYTGSDAALRDYNRDEFLHLLARAHPAGFVFFHRLDANKAFLELCSTSKNMLIVDLYDPPHATLGRLERLDAMIRGLRHDDPDLEIVNAPTHLPFSSPGRIVEAIADHQRRSPYYEAVRAQRSDHDD